MQRYRILIVGAGIAGAAAATFLSRRGHDITVVERSAAARSSGSPVDIRGPGLTAVRNLGAEDRLRARDTGVRTIAFVDRRGRAFTTVGMRPSPEDIEIARTDLAEVLTTLAQDAVDFRFDDTFTTLAPDDDGVDVTFAAGRQERFDLVVGADGQHSATRRALWDTPGAPQTASASVGLAIATVPLPLEIADPTVVEMYNEPGVSLTVHPAGGHPGVAFIFRAAGVPAGFAAQRDFLRATYASTGWRAGEFLDALGGVAADDVYVDGVEQVRASRWVSGPVVLLGDAASSLTILGNGSSTALAGAEALDRALAASPDIPTALVRYEHEHRPFATRAQRGAAAGAAFLVPRSAVGLGIRDLLARMMRTV